MIEVAATDAFLAWYDKITVEDALAVEHAVAHIELEGSAYGELVRRVGEGDGVQIYQLRLLKNGNPNRPISLCYATDLSGRFVLLLDGNRDGSPDLCDGVVASAEALWRDYLRSTTNGRGDGGSHGAA
jgi:hypothetical protein